MRTLLAIAVIAATSVTAHATAIYTIGSPIVNPANQHTYHLLSESSWTDAEAYAQTLGGHLATINDAAENTWVFNTFPPLTGDSQTGLLSLWIGYNDAAVEGNWVWTSGETPGFTYWHSTNPDNLGDEDYATIRPAPASPPAGSWNDLNNVGGGAVGHVYGVVEIVPEPSSFALMGLGVFGFLFRKISKKS
ncbi:MAG: lectin-like protein [Verrucomicrobiota bacterium]